MAGFTISTTDIIMMLGVLLLCVVVGLIALYVAFRVGVELCKGFVKQTGFVRIIILFILASACMEGLMFAGCFYSQEMMWRNFPLIIYYAFELCLMLAGVIFVVILIIYRAYKKESKEVRRRNINLLPLLVILFVIAISLAVVLKGQ